MVNPRGTTADRGDDIDPVRAFVARLRQLQIDSGSPSVRDLERLSGKVGHPQSRGSIQAKLTGQTKPDWPFVTMFVRACARHAGAEVEPDLQPWRAWHTEMVVELAAQRQPSSLPPSVQVCPYRGLEAFTAEDAAWFHGRTAAVQQVLAALDAHRRALLLLGPSGAGKSSLAQAGILPALAAGQLAGSDNWITVVVRPGQDLLAELNRCGIPGADAEPLRVALARRCADQAPGRRLLLVIDQFEELLTPSASEQQDQAQRQALDQLTEAIGAPRLTLALIMRDDFYPRLASQAPALLEMLTPGLVNLPASLSPAELRDIIIKPAEAVGLGWEADLPDRIIADVMAYPDATTARSAPITILPLLEMTLQQLWQRRRNGCLTHDAYQRIGGVIGGLAGWCDTAVEQLPPGQQAIAARILTALVRPADDDRQVPAVRQQVHLTVLRDLADTPDASLDAQGTDQVFDEVLATLTTHRIVTTRAVRPTGHSDDSAAVPVAELVHDALIRDWGALRDWVNRDHRFQDWLRRADERCRRWTISHTSDDLLYGSDLAEGLDWRRQRRLPHDTATFLTASHRHQQAEVRRVKRLNAFLITLLVVVLAVAGVAGWQWQNAEAAKRLALSRQLAAQSASLLGTNPDLASLLAVHAYQTSPPARQPPAFMPPPLNRSSTGWPSIPAVCGRWRSVRMGEPWPAPATTGRYGYGTRRPGKPAS